MYVDGHKWYHPHFDANGKEDVTNLLFYDENELKESSKTQHCSCTILHNLISKSETKSCTNRLIVLISEEFHIKQLDGANTKSFGFFVVCATQFGTVRRKFKMLLNIAIGLNFPAFNSIYMFTKCYYMLLNVTWW